MRGIVFPRPHKWVINDRGQRVKAPLEPYEVATDEHGDVLLDRHGEPIKAGPAGSAWTWQITIGIKARGTRRTVSRGGYPTREEAEHALVEANKRADRQRTDPEPSLTFVPLATDEGTVDILDQADHLLDFGGCSAACLLAVEPEVTEDVPCGCRCDGAYHGLLRRRRNLSEQEAALARLRGIAAAREAEHPAIRHALDVGCMLKDIGPAVRRNPQALSHKYRPKRRGIGRWAS